MLLYYTFCLWWLRAFHWTRSVEEKNHTISHVGPSKHSIFSKHAHPHLSNLSGVTWFVCKGLTIQILSGRHAEHSISPDTHCLPTQRAQTSVLDLGSTRTSSYFKHSWTTTSWQVSLKLMYFKRAVVWMNRQCRWAERRSWSVQKPIDLETRGCIQTVKELYREHSWHHQFHVHHFLSGRFLVLYSGSFHMHSQGCTFVWKTLTWISSICTFYLLGQKTFRHGESRGTLIGVNSISVQPV